MGRAGDFLNKQSQRRHIGAQRWRAQSKDAGAVAAAYQAGPQQRTALEIEIVASFLQQKSVGSSFIIDDSPPRGGARLWREDGSRHARQQVETGTEDKFPIDA